MRPNYSDYFQGGMGAEAVRDLLDAMDLEKVAEELKETIETGKGPEARQGHQTPEGRRRILEVRQQPVRHDSRRYPGHSADLRPMVQLDGGRFATSDLNDLYRRVINRNNRLKRLLDLGAPEIIVNNEKRMLQEAVDALFDNGRRGRPVTGPGNRPLKSLSDMLKGKAGPLPPEPARQACRLFRPFRLSSSAEPEAASVRSALSRWRFEASFFVMKRLVELEYAANIKAAKARRRPVRGYVWDVLEEVIVDHPVLLNRAPTPASSGHPGIRRCW